MPPISCASIRNVQSAKTATPTPSAASATSADWLIDERTEQPCRRILPALFFFTTVTTIAALLLSTPAELRNYGQSLLATMGFAANIYFYLKIGYFAPDADTMPLLHLWSLAVEEQFYIFFPVLLLLVWRWRPNWRVALVSLALILSLAGSIRAQMIHPTGNFFLPHYRAWELLVGCLVALSFGRLRDRVSRHSTLRIAIELAGAALVIVPIFTYDALTPFPGTSAIPPVLGTAILIVTASPTSTVGRILSTRLFVGIGLISYSAYLWHQPLLAFARARLGGSLDTWLALVLICGALAMAYLSWRYIERPFRDRKHFTIHQIFAFGAVGSIGLAALGAILHLTHGLPQRFSPEVRALGATAELSSKRSCHTDANDTRSADKACRYFGKTVDFAVLGDSHGIELGYALAESLRPSGRGLVHLTFSGCGPLPNIMMENPGCSQWTRKTVDWLAANRDIHNVVIAYRHPFYMYGEMHRAPGQPKIFHPVFLRDHSAESARLAYMESFAGVVHQLRSANKKVYLVQPVPELPMHSDNYVYPVGWPFLTKPAPSAIAVADLEERDGAIRSFIAGLAASDLDVIVLDPRDAFCDNGQCFAVSDNTQLYFDDDHMSVNGARRFLETMIANGKLPMSDPSKPERGD
ncbi:MAG: acyltransferase family protein [Novosphingobium sp.]|nr:acyltransferase family protein [Novosphingobium sp.]